MPESPVPIRLAFCITDLDPGGAERALLQIVRRLDRDRWKPSVYCLAPPGQLVSEFEASDIPVTCFHARGLRNIGIVRKLASALRKQRPALLQTFLFHANLLGRLAGRWAGVPHIVSGIRVAEKRAKTHLFLDRLTNRLVERNVCVSQAVAEFSINCGGLKLEKTVVIRNGVDYERFAGAQAASLESLGIPAASRVLIFVGRLDPQKGLIYLLRALPDVMANNDDLHLLLVGDGPQREPLQTLATDLGIDQQVHFAGWRADVPALLKACDALVLPSLWEGLPNVVLEAMAAGIPVIASEVDGVGELIRSGETGFLVSPGSTESLREMLVQLCADSTQSLEISKTAQDIVNKEFKWSDVADDYARLYDEILNCRQSI